MKWICIKEFTSFGGKVLVGQILDFDEEEEWIIHNSSVPPEDRQIMLLSEYKALERDRKINEILNEE